MSLREALKKGKLIITSELAPPKGTDVSSITNIAMKLRGKIDAVNLTDGQGGNMRMCPMAAATFILNEGVDVIWQLTCRDRNRIGLQADCLGASALGIKNVLPMKGDDPKSGDNPEANGVFDLDTTELIKMINGLNNGIDLPGNELKGKTDFTIGCTAHPNLPDLEKQYQTTKYRFEIGATFIQTQICYDLDQLRNFISSLKEFSKKTIIGITPLKSFKMAQFMNEKVFGVNVPEEILNRMKSSENETEEGLKISKEIISEISKLGIGGVHIMAVGQEQKLPDIVEYLTCDVIRETVN